MTRGGRLERYLTNSPMLNMSGTNKGIFWQQGDEGNPKDVVLEGTVSSHPEAGRRSVPSGVEGGTPSAGEEEYTLVCLG